MRSDMYLVRIVDGKVSSYEVVAYEQRGAALRKRKPKAWKFGRRSTFIVPLSKDEVREYPCLSKPGVAAIAESWARAYDMAIELQEREAA